MNFRFLGFLGLGLIGTGLWGQDGKGSTFGDIRAKTDTLKNYAYKISGGADTMTGVYLKLANYDKGTLYIKSGDVELIGRGGFERGRIGKADWKPLMELVDANVHNDVFQRARGMYVPHLIVRQLAEDLGTLTGDVTSGFSGDLQTSELSYIVAEPWVGNLDLQHATNLKGHAKFVVTDRIITKVELSLSGTRSQQKTTRSGTYKMFWPGLDAEADPQTMPPKPQIPQHFHGTWNHVPAHGYYPHPQNQNQNQKGDIKVTVVIELTDIGGASLPETAMIKSAPTKAPAK